VGFFGDPMQSIYDGIGNLDAYKGDGLKQLPSLDSDAPNMSSAGVKQGTVRFHYSDSEELEPSRKYLSSSLG
jgi:hypothetical protein